MFNINIVTSLFEKSAPEMDTLQGERKTNVNLYDQSQIDLSEQPNALKMKTSQKSIDDLMCASLTTLSPFKTFHPNIGTSFFEGIAREMDTLQGERKANMNIYGQSQTDLSEQSNALKMKTTQESVDDLCASLTALSPDIIRVWEGFEPYESEEQKKIGSNICSCREEEN